MSDQTVAEYIRSTSKEHRKTLEELRRRIRGHLPEATEELSSSGFPVYSVGGEWIAGFASRGKGPMLYIMAPGVLGVRPAAAGPARTMTNFMKGR